MAPDRGGGGITMGIIFLLSLGMVGAQDLGRTLAEQPAMQLAAPVRAAIARLPQDKRDAVAQQIEAVSRSLVTGLSARTAAA